MIRDELRRGLSTLIGKRVAHILVQAPGQSIERTFLVFDDGTYYEFYGGSQIDGASGLSTGTLEDVREFVGGAAGVDFEV